MKPTVRHLRPEDLDSLARIRRVAFLDTTDYGQEQHRDRLRSRMEHMTGVFLDDELVAAGAMLPFRMFYEGEVIEVAGLASVVSAAEHRRKGHVREMLAAMLREQHGRGVAWSLEYPFDARYYARFGWQTIPTGLVVEAPTERFDRDGASFQGELLDRGDDGTVEFLRSVWADWAPRYNFSMSRDGNARPDWDLLVHGSPWEPQTQRATRFTYRVDDGFVVLHLSRREGVQIGRVVDWAWRTARDRRAIFAFLAGLRGQVDRIRMQFPFDDPLLLDLTPFAVEHPNPLQARIVDVERALKPLVTGADWELTLTVRDGFCDWNDGTFRLSDGTVRRVDGPGEVELSIGALALLVSGAEVEPSLLADADGDVDRLTPLARSVSRRPFMPLSDYF